MGIGLPKFSVLFFYYRIFGKTSHWFYVALRVVGAMNAAWFVAAFLSTLLQCMPVEKAWSTVQGGHCFSKWTLYLGTAIPSTIIDLCILLMPLPMLWRLRASRTKKLMIIGVFLCGYGYDQLSRSPSLQNDKLLRLIAHKQQRYSSLHWAPRRYC